MHVIERARHAARAALNRPGQAPRQPAPASAWRAAALGWLLTGLAAAQLALGACATTTPPAPQPQAARAVPPPQAPQPRTLRRTPAPLPADAKAAPDPNAPLPDAPPPPELEQAPPPPELELAAEPEPLEGPPQAALGVQGPPQGADLATYYPLPAGEARPGYGELVIVRVNGRQRLTIQLFDDQGRMRSAGLRQLKQALRDHRGDHTRTINTRLAVLLYLIGQAYQRPIHLISGYRKPGSKQQAKRKRAKRRRAQRAKRKRGVKRKRGAKRKGKAKRKTKGSHHGYGEAADIRLPGVPPTDLANFVRGHFERVGVGYYPTSQFVHVDVRKRSFYWRDPSGSGQPQDLHTVAIDPAPKPGSDWTLNSTRLPPALRRKKGR